jgi:hypothetical protein
MRYVPSSTQNRSLAFALCLALLAGAAGCNPGVALAVLVPGLASPCDYDGTLLIRLSGVGKANWGGTTKWLDRETNHGIRGRVAGGTVQVAFSDDSATTDMKLAGKAIEVFRGSEPISVPSKATAQGLTTGSCGHGYVTSYDLRALSPGRYTLVHRRARGINGEVSCGKELCPWGTFKGEAALVTELVIPDPAALPATTAAELKQFGERRVDRLRQCHRRSLPDVPSEGVLVEVDVVSDRAFGQIKMRGKPDTSEALAKCLVQALGYGEIESRPREPLIARYEVAMGKADDSDLILIQVSFLELVPAQPESNSAP